MKEQVKEQDNKELRDEVERKSYTRALEYLDDIRHSDSKQEPEALDYFKGVSSLIRATTDSKATDRASEGTQLAVIKMITKDEDERKKYVKEMLPGYNPTK